MRMRVRGVASPSIYPDHSMERLMHDLVSGDVPLVVYVEEHITTGNGDVMQDAVTRCGDGGPLDVLPLEFFHFSISFFWNEQ